MNHFQRIIKYAATAFGILLAISIIGMIATFGLHVLGFMGATTENFSDTVNFRETFSDVSSLDIEIGAGKLLLEEGDEFSVKCTGNTDDFSAQMRGKTLVIRQDLSPRFFFHTNSSSVVTVTVPKAVDLQKVTIETGAGSMDCTGLQCDEFNLTLGAGNADISGITADTATVESGVGKLALYDFSIGKLDLEGGVGKCDLKGRITGQASIHSGVGDMEVSLYGERSDYSFSVKTGIGQTTVDGRKMSDNSVLSGTGDAVPVKLECGIGRLKVDFYK